MYTLPSEKLMEMTKIQPHEELLSEGERFIWGFQCFSNLGSRKSQLIEWRFNMI